MAPAPAESGATPPPQLPLNAAEYETAARALLPASVYSYYAGGANDEMTLAANASAFGAISFLPRVLVPVGSLSTRTAALRPALRGGAAADLAFPALVAPMAMQRLCGEGNGRGGDGELAVAHAVDTVGIGMCLSTLATSSIESVAQGGDGGVRLFQLYVYRDREVTLGLVARARAAGYAALVLTVDSPLFGRRERDLRGDGFSLPPHLLLANFQTSERDNDRAALKTSQADGVGRSALQHYGSELIDPNLTWDDVSWLVAAAGMPVWLKGVVRPDDASRAVAAGVACVVVSNHGGRQLDGALSGLEALPGVVAAVDGRVPVVVDGGVRRGADVAKAVALGASAVLVGRPVLWALAAGGVGGVTRLLRLLHEEFRVAMALLGARAVQDVTRDLVAGGDCLCGSRQAKL
jgi:isopentenyl diphosphate isomerase/L-lactate dehydrogenase-like FMN-dependent dehydrogenase